MNVEIAGAGEPLVLLHGFTGSARSWGEFAQVLARQFTVVAVDLPGHGKTDDPLALDHYEMAAAVDDIVAAVAKLGLDRGHWLGYSMGGRTALHVAAAHPESVRSLTTIGASAGLDCIEDRVARRSADELLARRIERDGVEAFVDYWESIPLFATQTLLPAALRQRIREGRLGNSVVGLANSLRGMGAGAQEPLHGRLNALETPSLVVAGELDQKYVELGQQLAAAMPSARFAAAPGAGHAAHLECPAECAAIITGFIQSLETQRKD